jgi:hypothetical protein
MLLLNSKRHHSNQVVGLKIKLTIKFTQQTEIRVRCDRRYQSRQRRPVADREVD